MNLRMISTTNSRHRNSEKGTHKNTKLPALGASLAVPVVSASTSMALPSHGMQELLLPSRGIRQLLSPMPSLSTFPAHTSISVSMERSASPRIVCRSGFLKSAAAVKVIVSNGRPDGERGEIRLGLPSKGRMAGNTLDLLKRCQLSVEQLNPRQYVADIPQLSNLQVWFQRPEDIVRELLSGHLDIGIVGLDTVSEYGQGNKDLIIVHEALDYGHCRLSLALGHKFMKENGLKYVSFSTGEGALEAAPAMGTADVILDVVSSGTTLRENNLKEIEGGTVLESQAVLVASRKSLVQREGVLDTTHKILERLEAHLEAVSQSMVTVNMTGSSAEEVAKRVLSLPSLSGLEGLTVSPVFRKRDEEVVADCYAISICVPKNMLDISVQQLRAIGASRVLVSPLTCILDEGSPRWQQLLSELRL
ncbi:ATP phosphoribosyltransferase 2, chloroplastic-like isoform X2 [Rhodamnia argentea]|uniref:ATP phosphoribosyltransferase n=1 Tax=Rhodamnia argentea TaxID=178133 RepID=A0A8B8MSF6_9MYRT|nr:ATP phosphoribosyltransferase 2, chloroplastic-like isoform X2 [Rhodamnia argentea]